MSHEGFPLGGRMALFSWIAAGGFGVLSLASPGAINAAIGVGIVAVFLSGGAVVDWVTGR